MEKTSAALAQIKEQIRLNGGSDIKEEDCIAIELNGAIVSRKDYDKVTLKDGDSMEIVHFVGGG